MKWMSVLLIAISLGLHQAAIGQDLNQTFQFALQQFEMGNEQEAEKAFKRVLFFDSQNMYRSTCLLKLAEIATHNKDQLGSLNYLDQAYFQTSDPALQSNIQFDRIRIFIETKEFKKALAEIYQMDPDLYPDRIALYEGYCHYMLRDFISFESAFIMLCHTDEQKAKLKATMTEADKIEKINPKTYQVLSYIVPGLGQILLGDTKSSLNSILLNGGLIILFIDTARKLSLFDASISVVPWLFRYYSGGAKVTKDLAQERKHSKHEQNLLMFIESLNITS